MRSHIIWVFAFAVVSAGCATSRSSAVAPFALEWRGVDSAPTPSPLVGGALGKRTFNLQPCVDARAQQAPSVVGKVEETNSDVVVNGNVIAFCTDRLMKLLTESGFRLAATPDAVMLTPELVAFNVVEGNTYAGDARLRMNVAVPGGTTVAGLYAGTSKRFVRSQSPDNYNEALSNAFAGAVEKFVRDEEVFGKAIAPPAP